MWENKLKIVVANYPKQTLVLHAQSIHDILAYCNFSKLNSALSFAHL